MIYFKYLFITLALTISLVYANSDSLIAPNVKYDHYLSPVHPLSATELTNNNQKFSITSGNPTYTYVRCYYKVSRSSDQSDPQVATNYIWAINSNGSDYKLNGYWYADGVFEWKNMFYTNTLDTDIKAACINSLKTEKKGDLVDIYAADNQLSFDHTIWHNVTDSKKIKYDRVVGFGDSLSDTHNIYNASQWKLPNNTSWFLGRFTDGKVWSEYLADNMLVPYYPWAIGGTETEKSHIVIPEFSAQLQSFEEYMAETKNYNINKTLFTVWIGGNDFLKTDRTVDQVINNIDKSLNELIRIGGKNIVILNLPDLTTAPVWKYKKDKDKATILNNTLDYNIKLAKVVTTIQHKFGSSVNIQLFDSYAFFDKMMKNPGMYGIENISDSCLNINEDSSTKYMTAQKRRRICKNPDRFAFWDTLHPSTIIHKLLAEEVAKALTKPIDSTPADTPKDLLYIANFDSYNVSAATLDNNYGKVDQLPKLFTAENNPQKIIFDNKKSFAYVLNTGSDSISIYEVSADGSLRALAPDQTIHNVTNNGRAQDILYHNGYIYITSPDNNIIVIFKQDPTNGSLIRISSQNFNSETGRLIKPKSIIFKDDIAYVLGYDSIQVCKVSEVDGGLTNLNKTYELKTLADTFKFGNALNDQFLFVASSTAKTITVLTRLSDGSLGAGQYFSMAYAPTNIEVSKDGTMLFVTHATLNTLPINKLSIFFIKHDGKIEFANIIDTKSDPNGMTINSSGKYLLVANSGEGSFSVYEIQSKPPYLNKISEYSSGGYRPIAITTIPKPD